MGFKKKALVLGMFETGLGVARSLGTKGIRVIGIDHKRDIGFYSRFVEARLCPHPAHQEEAFIAYMLDLAKSLGHKPVLFITSDEFLKSISQNRERLEPHFLFNLPPKELIKNLVNKHTQYELVKGLGIDIPETFVIASLRDAERIKGDLPYPLIIKASDVIAWRTKVSATVKGFVAKNADEFLVLTRPILESGVNIVAQEIIEGPDTNHFKYCAYISEGHQTLCHFMLQKIRQNPIHFGVGAVVESIELEELRQLGSSLLQKLKYKGVGSIEFKRDQKDGRLKLIEINPRYWQQIYLATFCGVNFPYFDYMSITGASNLLGSTFETGVKWINHELDFDSFLKYRAEGSIDFWAWRKSLRGKKIYSDFIWADPWPGFYKINFGKRLFKIPFFLLKKLFS